MPVTTIGQTSVQQIVHTTQTTQQKQTFQPAVQEPVIGQSCSSPQPMASNGNMLLVAQMNAKNVIVHQNQVSW
jgi:hypothetical protein